MVALKVTLSPRSRVPTGSANNRLRADIRGVHVIIFFVIAVMWVSRFHAAIVIDIFPIVKYADKKKTRCSYSPGVMGTS